MTGNNRRTGRQKTGRFRQWCQQVADATIYSGRGAQVSDAQAEQVNRTLFARDGALNLVPLVRPLRTAELLVPPLGTRPNGRLLVLLHGCRQHARHFAVDTGAHNLCVQSGWHVLLPNQVRLANIYRCWNWFDRAVYKGGGEVAIVARGIEEVCAEYSLDPGQVSIAGMSSGAGLAAAICAHHPTRFNAALLHSGVAYGASTSAFQAKQAIREGPQRDTTQLVTSANGPATLVVHGARDEVVVPTHADELMRQMLVLSGALSAGAALPEVSVAVDDSAGQFVPRTRRYGVHQQVMIDNLGHAWSGGTRQARYFEPAAPDALGMFERFVNGLPA